MPTVVGLLVVISEHHLSAGQTLLLGALQNPPQCADKSRIIGRNEEDQRCNQDRCI
jgi:hypothetical protein